MCTYFERKPHPDDKLDDYIKSFQFKEYEVGIKGSSMMKNLKYYGDYDLYSYVGKVHKYVTHIKNTYNTDVLKDEIIKIIQDTSSIEDTYFISLKLGNSDKSSIISTTGRAKGVQTSDVPLQFIKAYKEVSPIEFIQLEYITYLNNRFIAITSDYFFRKDTPESKVLSDLKSAIKSNIEKDNYFKVLKRIFNIFQLKYEHNDKYDVDKLTILCEFFNSGIGKSAVTSSNLKTIALLLTAYPSFSSDVESVKKLKLNMKNIGVSYTSNVKTIMKRSEALDKVINTASKELYNNLI